MSDMLPLRRTRFLTHAAGAPDLEEPSPCRPFAEDREHHHDQSIEFSSLPNAIGMAF
jgi:hypothetical protein